MQNQAIKDDRFNKHLAVVFDEILPALTGAGIKYWVMGGVGVAGVAGKFLRENQDVDVYVLHEDFPVVEETLKFLCENHGAWDGDEWSLVYSVLKTTKRWKLEIFIKGKEVFSVVPVYKTESGVDFRVPEKQTASFEALTEVGREIDGHVFISPPDEIILHRLRFLIERYIEHYDKPEPVRSDLRHLIDARALFPADQIEEWVRRFNEKARTVAEKRSLGDRKDAQDAPNSVTGIN